jgi:hypothetical protein
MSERGQKRGFEHVPGMSALHPIATVLLHYEKRRGGPTGDERHRNKKSSLSGQKPTSVDSTSPSIRQLRRLGKFTLAVQNLCVLVGEISLAARVDSLVSG